MPAKYVLLVAALFVVQLCAAIDIVTEYGPVRGQTIPVTLESGDYNIHSFWGIPYARSPVGSLRFAPPQKAVPWTGTFVANELPTMCMQNPIGLMFMTHPFWTKYGENCLFLNIATPEDTTIPHPVMVYFHGGGYTGGGSIQYPGHFLAARGVVVVTVNYRLGVFGFASTPDGSIPGNQGLYDQVLALEFVRDNIMAFGGRPNQVTIFGQSAGASSSSLLMVSPKARGLFHQAILESGAETNMWSINSPESSPENYILQVARNANCTTDDQTEMLACLRLLSARELREADSIQCTPGYFCQGFAPVVDGPGGFIPENPRLLRDELKENSVPFIGGLCRDDGSLYTIYFIPEANDGGFTREEFEFYLRTRLVDIYKESLTPEEYENAYNAMDFQYSPWPYLDDLEANRQAFNKLITDAGFGYSWDRQAKINSQYKDTYTYIQAFLSLNSTSFIPEWMGVPHEGELAYVWAYAYLLINPAVREDTGIFFDIVGWTVEDMPYGDYVQTLWSNFAKFGNPTPSPIKAPFNDTLTTWPKFSIEDNLKVLYLDGEISVKENYRQQDYAFYTHYAPTVVNHPIKKASVKRPTDAPGFKLKSSQFQREITKRVEDMLTTRFPGQYEEALEELKRAENMEHYLK